MRAAPLLGVLLLALAGVSMAAAPLDLKGFADESGAISVQYNGDTVDPYFALQALLLAQENGLDISPYATRWANWMMARQKPDATFDRFCRRGPVWAPCKTADADDSQLALWLKFLEGNPTELQRNAAWQKSHRSAAEALARLVDPRSHVYLVSPVYPHALFMDNLEVWSLQAAPDLTRAIRKVFWSERDQRFLVSTQPEQKSAEYAFYPDAVAQIFPLVVHYPVPGGARAWYGQWIARHRAEWLAQVRTDFAWGLVALVAWQQGDAAAASCWLRTTQPFARGAHWTVTDEVVMQVLAQHGVAPETNKRENC